MLDRFQNDAQMPRCGATLEDDMALTNTERNLLRAAIAVGKTFRSCYATRMWQEPANAELEELARATDQYLAVTNPGWINPDQNLTGDAAWYEQARAAREARLVLEEDVHREHVRAELEEQEPWDGS